MHQLSVLPRDGGKDKPINKRTMMKITLGMVALSLASLAVTGAHAAAPVQTWKIEVDGLLKTYQFSGGDEVITGPAYMRGMFSGSDQNADGYITGDELETLELTGFELGTPSSEVSWLASTWLSPSLPDSITFDFRYEVGTQNLLVHAQSDSDYGTDLLLNFYDSAGRYAPRFGGSYKHVWMPDTVTRISPVPEPQVWALAAAGMWVTAAAMRRRRASAAVR
jgi:hypothetical protein